MTALAGRQLVPREEPQGPLPETAVAAAPPQGQPPPQAPTVPVCLVPLSDWREFGLGPWQATERVATDDAAAAAIATWQPLMGGPTVDNGSIQAYTLDFLRRLGMQMGMAHGRGANAEYELPTHFADHNASVKWARKLGLAHCGQRRGIFHWRHDVPERIPTIGRYDHGGADYFFDVENRFAWHFATLLANLKDEHLAFVCQGPSGRSSGIVSCALTNYEGHCDPKCSRKDGVFRYTWDLVFLRADGTMFWLHPNATKSDVSYGEMGGVVQLPPAAGAGASSGPGSYKLEKNQRQTRVLKLDRAKNTIKKVRQYNPAAAGHAINEGPQ